MIGQQVRQGGGMPAAAPSAAPPAAAPASPPTGQPAGTGDVAAPDGQQPNVTPEEQAQYDQFVKNGLAMIYPGGSGHAVAPAILAHLKGDFGKDETAAFEQAQPPLGQSPNDALAATTVMIVLALDGSAGKAGHQVEDDVVMHGGVAILEELAEVSQAAGIHDYSEGEMEAASYRAMDLFRVSSPRVDQDQLKEQFGQIVQANQSGQLDKLLPGIGERVQAADQAGQQQDPSAQPPQPPQAG